MSIIEKALERLEKTDIKRSATAPAIGGAIRESHAEDFSIVPERVFDNPEPLHEVIGREQPSKQSRRVKLDIKALRKGGILVPDAMDTMRAEQYRRIKRPILQNAFEGKTGRNSNLVLVTSSVAGEGKSYTSLNLAMSVAGELDRKVLLIDGDVFKQSLSHRLHLQKEAGLSNFLKTEGADLADYLLRTDEVPNLTFLPCGLVDHQLTELWSSDRMRNLMDELAARYSDRLVIFDSPPLLEQTSTAILAGLVGQVVLVVEAEKTPQHVVNEALELIGDLGRVGLVLNKSNQRFSSEYGYGYSTQKQ